MEVRLGRIPGKHSDMEYGTATNVKIKQQQSKSLFLVSFRNEKYSPHAKNEAYENILHSGLAGSLLSQHVK